jgi:hypothetical protein
MTQSDIDFIVDTMGGTVPQGHGCAGTTHGPPDAEHDPAGWSDPDYTRPATIKYQCWMHIDNVLDFDLPTRSFVSIYTTRWPAHLKIAFKLFEIELKTSDLENYSRNEILTRDRLSPAEVRYILDNETYQDYFTNVFDAEIIGILPIIHNFYLTNNYFSDIRQAMRSTKNRVFDILNTTIDNHDSYNSTPDLARLGARTVSLSNSDPDADSLARDFILKMIIKTPIDIIKGLMQMIDPHVIITKFIKAGTGDAFSLIQRELRGIDLPSPDGGNPTAPFADGATGADLFTAVLCLLQQLMENPPNFPFPPPFPGTPGPNFYPHISKDGVDFLGTGMGMLMIPPTPFGLIYLLLSLINFDTTQPNLDVGVEFGSDPVPAGATATGLDACAEDLIIEPEEEEESEEPLDAVRPPYVPGES